MVGRNAVGSQPIVRQSSSNIEDM